MEKIPTKKCLLVLMDANARTVHKMEGVVMIKVECLERMDVMFLMIRADSSCRSPPIAC